MHRFFIKNPFILTTMLLALCAAKTSVADGDTRQLVEFPEMMQQHMLANMRDHLATINQILEEMAMGEMDNAAAIAEARLGMSSLESHGASHMAGFMPEGMQSAGTAMHRSASRFALRAEEGDAPVAYKALAEVTATCVACHSAYRIR